MGDRRGRPIAGLRCEVFDHFVRYTPERPGLEGLIVFDQLPEEGIDQAIAAQTAHFADVGCDWEWKVYDFDQPRNLATRLRAHGFVPGDTEAFMVYPTRGHVSRPLRPGVGVHVVTSDAAIRTVVEIQKEVWHEDLEWLEGSLREDLARTVLLLAYVNDQPVGTGWVQFNAHSSFADLHGGSVLPEFRGRGVYSALFDYRADAAKARGIPYLAVDAAPMSRPILVKQGFTFVCETTPFHWRRERDVTLGAAPS